MPKGFSERERELIRAKLLACGRDFIASYGIRKTSIEDLTRAAGISKGAFYLFFGSKEELFFEVFQQFEAEYQAALLGAIGATSGSAHERFGAFLRRAFSLWKSNPIFSRFDRAELEQLVRRLPPEQLAEGVRNDEAFAERLIKRWDEEGVCIASEPKLLVGLLRALFFVSMHGSDLGEDVYPAVLDALIEMYSARLVR